MGDSAFSFVWVKGLPALGLKEEVRFAGIVGLKWLLILTNIWGSSWELFFVLFYFYSGWGARH